MKTNEVNYTPDATTDAAKPLFSDLMSISPWRYRHKSTGGIYEIITISTDHATGEKLQVYQSVETAEIHSRPLSEFVQKFELI